jgi:hypothetical protein
LSCSGTGLMGLKIYFDNTSPLRMVSCHDIYKQLVYEKRSKMRLYWGCLGRRTSEADGDGAPVQGATVQGAALA